MGEKKQGFTDSAKEVLAILGQLTDPVLEQGDIGDVLTFVGLFQQAAEKLPNGQGAVIQTMAEEHVERVLVGRIKKRDDLHRIVEQKIAHPWFASIEKRAQTDAVSNFYTRIITKAFEQQKAEATPEPENEAATGTPLDVAVATKKSLHQDLDTDGKTMGQRVGDFYSEAIDGIQARLTSETDHVNPEDIKHDVIKFYVRSIIDALSVEAPSEGIEEPMLFIFKADFAQKFEQAWDAHIWPVMSNMKIMQSIRFEHLRSVDHFVEYMEDSRARQKMHPVVTAWRSTIDLLIQPPALQLQAVPEISKNPLKKKESKEKRTKIEEANERKRQEHAKAVARSREFLASLGFPPDTANIAKKDIAEILSLIIEILPTKALHQIQSTEAALIEKIGKKQEGAGDELSERMIHSKISRICRDTYGLWGELVALKLYYGHRDRMLQQAEVKGTSMIAASVKRDSILESIAHRAPRGGWKYLSEITQKEQKKASMD